MSTLDINTGQLAANASESDRSAFIRRTYTHVAGALVALAAIVFALIESGIALKLTSVLRQSSYFWLIIMGLYMAVSYIAEKWAHSQVSKGVQYAGLGFYVVATAVIFSPAIFIGSITNPDLITQAIIITAALAAGITFTVFTTKKNFSFMGGFLRTAMFVFFGVIVASILFDFTLGTAFMGVGVLLMGGMLLYDTSNVVHEYRTTQHVAAALSVFGSVAFLFYYVFNLLMSMGGD